MPEERIGWIELDAAYCGFCGHRHALEIVYRCVGCDRETCALCFVHIRERGEGYCPECAPRER